MRTIYYKHPFANGSYPSTLPQRVLLSGDWPSSIGVVVHVEIRKFLSTLNLGEPMVFEIYGQIQQLLQSADELEPLSLRGALGQSSPLSSSSVAVAQSKHPETTRANKTTTTDKPKPKDDSKKRKPSRQHVKLKRPTERSSFWSVLPEQSPPAEAFPKISKSLEDCRKALPAAKARADFLAAMKEAEKVSLRSA